MCYFKMYISFGLGIQTLIVIVKYTDYNAFFCSFQLSVWKSRKSEQHLKLVGRKGLLLTGKFIDTQPKTYD